MRGATIAESKHKTLRIDYSTSISPATDSQITYSGHTHNTINSYTIVRIIKRDHCDDL